MNADPSGAARADPSMVLPRARDLLEELGVTHRHEELACLVTSLVVARPGRSKEAGQPPGAQHGLPPLLRRAGMEDAVGSAAELLRAAWSKWEQGRSEPLPPQLRDALVRRSLPRREVDLCVCEIPVHASGRKHGFRQGRAPRLGADRPKRTGWSAAVAVVAFPVETVPSQVIAIRPWQLPAGLGETVMNVVREAVERLSRLRLDVRWLTTSLIDDSGENWRSLQTEPLTAAVRRTRPLTASSAKLEQLRTGESQQRHHLLDVDPSGDQPYGLDRVGHLANDEAVRTSVHREALEVIARGREVERDLEDDYLALNWEALRPRKELQVSRFAFLIDCARTLAMTDRGRSDDHEWTYPPGDRHVRF